MVTERSGFQQFISYIIYFFLNIFLMLIVRLFIFSAVIFAVTIHYIVYYKGHPESNEYFAIPRYPFIIIHKMNIYIYIYKFWHIPMSTIPHSPPLLETGKVRWSQVRTVWRMLEDVPMELLMQQGLCLPGSMRTCSVV